MFNLEEKDLIPGLVFVLSFQPKNSVRPLKQVDQICRIVGVDDTERQRFNVVWYPWVADSLIFSTSKTQLLNPSKARKMTEPHGLNLMPDEFTETHDEHAFRMLKYLYRVFSRELVQEMLDIERQKWKDPTKGGPEAALYTHLITTARKKIGVPEGYEVDGGDILSKLYPTINW